MSNSRAWAGYDNWLLQGSGVDDYDPEIFETTKHKLFSAYEHLVTEFDDKIKVIEDIGKKHEDYCADTYDNYLEFLQERVEDLQDDLGLHNSECDAIDELAQDQQDKKEQYLEAKAEWQREARRNRDL